MKKRSFILFSILLVFAAFSSLSAQEIEKSTKTEFIGNTEYYLHTVTQGQTIYAISKAYTVSVDDIFSANPDAKKGINTGVVLKIPLNKSNEPKKYINHTVLKGETLYEISFNYNVKVNDIININPGLTEKIKAGQTIMIPVVVKKQAEPVKNNLGLHIVQKGETLSAIARQYSTTVEELKKLNPGLTDVIQIGQQIKTPFVKAPEKQIKKDSVTAFECGKTGLKDTYHIALLIPFYLDKTYNIDTADDKTPASAYKSLSFIQYYEGIRIALDSLEKNGLSLMVYVFDVNENTDAEDFIKQKTELKNMDLIIGPFFMNSFTVFADWAKQNKINIINPFTKKATTLENNPQTFKLFSSENSQSVKVISFIADTYPGCNMFIVHKNADSCLSDAFEKNAPLMSEDNKRFTLHMVNYSKEGLSGISKNLSENAVNVIITLADGEAFVSAYIRNLNELAYRYKMVLFAQSSWEQYPSLDQEYLMNLNMHIFENYFIDYSDSDTKIFIRKFREKYKTDPDYYGFHGYDIMMYFSGALKKYGKNFQECLDKYNPELLETEFVFKKTDSGGYENTSCMIYRYEDYKAINALTNPKKEIILLEKKKP